VQRATSDFDWIDDRKLRCAPYPHAGQYRAEKYWSITTIMQPVSAFSSVVRAPRLRLEEPAGALNSYLIEKLSRAAAPLVVAAIARHYLTEQGLVANKPRCEMDPPFAAAATGA
jgi:hypothetical protein